MDLPSCTFFWSFPIKQCWISQTEYGEVSQTLQVSLACEGRTSHLQHYLISLCMVIINYISWNPKPFSSACLDDVVLWDTLKNVFKFFFSLCIHDCCWFSCIYLPVMKFDQRQNSWWSHAVHDAAKSQTAFNFQAIYAFFLMALLHFSIQWMEHVMIICVYLQPTLQILCTCTVLDFCFKKHSSASLSSLHSHSCSQIEKKHNFNSWAGLCAKRLMCDMTWLVWECLMKRIKMMWFS